jgi:hypothetical protein
VWHRKLDNIRVLNTAELMGLGNTGNMTEEEATLRAEDLVHLWGTDPVHPTRDAYTNLGRALLQQAAPTPTGGSKRKADPEPGQDLDYSRERRDHSHESRMEGRDYSPESREGTIPDTATSYTVLADREGTIPVERPGEQGTIPVQRGGIFSQGTIPDTTAAVTGPPTEKGTTFRGILAPRVGGDGTPTRGAGASILSEIGLQSIN